MMSVGLPQIEYTTKPSFCQLNSQALQQHYTTTTKLITTEDIVKEQNQIIMDSILSERAQQEYEDSLTDPLP